MHSKNLNDVFIGLGSNLEQPLEQVKRALKELSEHPELSLITSSPLYRSKAIGPSQADYINAVAQIKTPLSALQLLDQLQHIEQLHQRVRIQHWGPRTLDLDILLYGNASINNERLIIPHAHMCERNFVLQPLHDIAPDLHLPSGISIASLLAGLGTAELKPIPQTEYGSSS
ncbi:2-amino-4-hydroxy-6-hydroxymethyldihydropteridinediphosphokinase [Alteromonadaceae bacterium Bs31]|nr:2-amino-4-hydroxy-6-hydroxymethyldihydropteridinediphosphokinase [Alteromonadaceae bacterium Bs31]